MTINKNTMLLDWATRFVMINPTIYDKNGLWWTWDFDNSMYVETDETHLLNGIRKGEELGDYAIVKERHLHTAIRLIARDRMPLEMPLNKIQFASTVFDLDTGVTEPILDNQEQPKFFATNSIPWELGDKEDTPTLDRLFTEWVGEKYVPTLYELLAYCCYRGYPLHKIAVLNGCGRNGKGSFLRIVEKFLGEKNLASTDFERLIGNRFETFNLYRKLAASIAETNFAVLKSTSLLKRLSGDDLVPFEKKGGRTIQAHNYAVPLIATNSLPISEDETEGFYRRWLIIDFPNTFPEGKEVSLQVPDAEFRNLARKVTRILPELLDRGSFTNEGTIAERKRAYIKASNPFPDFLRERCYTEDPEACINRIKLRQAYERFCREAKKRPPSPKEFTKLLDKHGFYYQKTYVDNKPGTWVWGVKLKESPVEFGQKKPPIPVIPVIPQNQLHPPRIRAELNHEYNEYNRYKAAEKAEFEKPSSQSDGEPLTVLEEDIDTGYLEVVENGS